MIVLVESEAETVHFVVVNRTITYFYFYCLFLRHRIWTDCIIVEPDAEMLIVAHAATKNLRKSDAVSMSPSYFWHHWLTNGRKARSRSIPTDSCKFSLKEIKDNRHFDFAPKLPQMIISSSTLFAHKRKLKILHNGKIWEPLSSWPQRHCKRCTMLPIACLES